jgi:hypothetical protein
VGAIGSGQDGRPIALQFKYRVPSPSFDAAFLQGLDRVDKAIDAWTRALGVLPVENMTPAERKQRDQYHSELAAAKVMFEDFKANPKEPEEMKTIHISEYEKLAWKRARPMIPGLIASHTWDSSVRCSCMRPPLDVILTLFSGCM